MSQGNTGGGIYANGSNQPTKMTWKTKPRVATGSAFDTTSATNPKQRAGGHQMNRSTVDPSAFGQEKITKQKTPSNFLKRGTGTGGRAPSESRTVYREAQDMEKDLAYSSTKKKGIKKATQARANPPNTDLRRFYERGDLPIQCDHRGVKNALMWKVDIDQLDFHHYLPIFFSGLREIEAPYCDIARQGTLDLLRQGKEKVLPVIPQLIIPLKEALNTRDRGIIQCTLKMIQQLVLCGVDDTGAENSLIGQALVPYYRQLLPIFNIYINQRENTGDEIVYCQQNHENLNELITETLEVMEFHGGEDAFINIKYLVPTYESINS